MDTPRTDTRYDEDYFIRGKQSGKSLYENYRWLPDLTVPMAERIIDHCSLELSDVVLDFGCARGYLVKALRMCAQNAIGYDVSPWALENCDPDVKGCLSNEWPPRSPVDWIIAKDVLEHIPIHSVGRVLRDFAERAIKGVFIVVPLASALGEKYVVPEYEADITHCVRWPLATWVEECHEAFDEQWEISARYRIHGIKDNYAQFRRGNGFITARRITW